jgi:hypothetical protein
MWRHNISVGTRRHALNAPSRGHDSCIGGPWPGRGPAAAEITPVARDAVSEVLGAGAVFCPECGMPAWVEWGDAVTSTSGAVELAKVRCFSRHWFLMPADRLPR